MTISEELPNVTKTYYSQNFELVNEDLRRHFRLANKEIEKVKEKVNELVIIVHRDNKDWSLNKICNYIAGKNDDLEDLGFSAKTIERYLTEENRKMLVDPSIQKGRNRIKLQNKVTDNGIDNCRSNVIEKSSSSGNTTTTIPTEYKIENAQTVGDKVDYYDGLQQKQQQEREVSIEEYKLLKQQIEEQNKQIQKISETNERERSIKKQLPKEVVKIAEDVELSPSKLELLNNTRLKKHPRIQKSLVYKIKDYSPQKARDIVQQTIHNLETGYVKQDEETGEYTRQGLDKKEDIKEEQKLIQKEDPDDVYFDITANTKKLLFSLTGRTITKGEYRYTEDIIKKTHNYRLQVVKSLDSDTMKLNTLYLDYLKLVKIAADDMMRIIEQEMEFAKDKKEMMKE